MIKKISLHFLKEFKYSILIDELGRFLEIFVTFVLVDVSGMITDDLVSNNLQPIMFYLQKFLLVSAISVVLVPIFDFLINKVLVTVGARFDLYIYEIFLKQKYPVVDKYPTKDIVLRLYNDAIAFRLDLFSLVTAISGYIVIFTCLSVYLAYINLTLTLVLIAVTLTVVLVPAYTNKLSEEVLDLEKASKAKLNSYELELIEHKEFLRVNNYQDKLFEKLSFFTSDSISKTIKSRLIALFKTNVIYVITYFSQFIFILIGTLFIASNKITPGEFITFTGSGFILKRSIEVINLRLSNTLPHFKSVSKRVVGILEDEEDDKLDAIEHLEQLSFENVSFSYDDDTVIDGLTLEINQGDIVKIVGENGSGKSTLVKLMLKLYQINSGEIKVNGINISELSARSLRDKIRYAEQNPVLFNTNVYDNIVLNSGQDATEVMELLKIGDLRNVVVDEASKNISGGQRKKIALARELIHAGDILIIDELRNFLDSESYQNVLSYIKKHKKTLVFISHGNEEVNFNKTIVL